MLSFTCPYILHRVPDSVLWLRVPSQLGAQSLKQLASKLGVDPQRILIGKYASTREEHLEIARLMDLHLDPTPYSSHVTSADALWAGVPTITLLQSDKMCARIAASFLSAMEVPSLITRSWKEYHTNVRVNFYDVDMKILLFILQQIHIY